jgi:hypothetical protein
MASLTKKLKAIRKNKLTKSGKTRKVAARKGTTPRFPVHLSTDPDCIVPAPPGSSPLEK